MTYLKSKARKYGAEVLSKSGVLQRLEDKADCPWKILTYHRVVNPEDSQLPVQAGMFVRPETFAMQMQFLRANCSVISLSELLNKLHTNSPVAPNTVVITFDDGWEDNYLNAFPVLTEFKLKASVFLATGFIGTGKLFWTDSVCYALVSLWREFQKNRSPQLKAEVSEISCFQKVECFASVFHAHSIDSLMNCFESLLEMLKGLDAHERMLVHERLVQVAKKFELRSPDSTFMNWKQVREMDAAGIEFGSHSHTHQYFDELSDEQESNDISQSLELLRTHCMHPLTNVFCYPGGRYNDAAQNFLSRHGFEYALSTEKFHLQQSAPVLLGRIGIHEDITNTPAMFHARFVLNR